MDIELFKQKKVVEQLSKASGKGTTLVSLLLPPNEQINKINSMLVEEISAASSIQSRVTRQNVIEALKSLSHKVKTIS